MLELMSQIVNAFFPPSDEREGASSIKTKFLAVVGDTVWQELSAELISRCLKPLIPDDLHEFEQFKSQDAVAMARFEESVLKLGFIRTPQLKLSTYVSELDVHFLEKRREVLLLELRKIVTGKDTATVLVVEGFGQGALYSLKCVAQHFP
jgi:hypothetical protein